MNVLMLLGIIRSSGETQDDAAKAIGKSRSCFNSKLHGRGGATFTQPEIVALKNHYHLSMMEVEQIFFAS